MTDVREAAIAAVKPKDLEVVRAIEVILRELASGMKQTAELKDPVAKSLKGEPFGPFDQIDVPLEVLQRAHAVGALVTALAHLQSTGHVLPFGKMVSGGELADFLVMRTAGPPGYRVGDQFNFEIAEVYVLPRGAVRPDLDPPLVLLERLPERMGSKVRRVLLEAAEAYRARLYVGAAMLLGTASEVAMEQLAGVVLARTNDRRLRELLEETASTSRLHAYIIDQLTALRTPSAKVRLLEGMANTYRELRNHAVHEPEGAFDALLFDRSVVAALMTSAIPYFTCLYEVLAFVEQPPRATD